MDDILFAVNDYDGELMVIVVRRKFWEENHLMSDEFDEDINARLTALGFGEEMESTYASFEGLSREAIIERLEANGLVHSKEFEEFSEGFAE